MFNSKDIFNRMESNRIWVLIGKKKNGEASVSELHELEELLAANTGSGYLEEEVDKLWEAPMKAVEPLEPGANVWPAIISSINRRQWVLRLTPATARWLTVAAMVVLLAGAGVWAFLLGGQRALQGGVLTEISTKMASRSSMLLPDGTQVFINGNSRIIYNAQDFGKQNREVKLIGEAFFDVAKDARHPFIIHAGVVNIRVLGTAFNVKAYPKQKQVETSLLSGIVEITTVKDPERKIVLKPDEKIIIPLDDPETPVLETEGTTPATYSILQLKKNGHQVLPETAWMNKTLEFDNETFEELAARLESWYSVTIRFTGDKIGLKRFTGLIENENLQQTLDAMKLSYPFTYTIKDDEVTINSK